MWARSQKDLFRGTFQCPRSWCRMLADRKADAERQPWIVRMKERCSERSARLGYVHPRIAGHDAGQVAFRAECL